MKKFVLLTQKSWHDNILKELAARPDEEWIRIQNRRDLNLETLEKLAPDFVFIPHWSYIIPEEIWSAYPCVVFHMTDLPYGRGGSPLQNLIVRGHKFTKISALNVNEGIDTGDLYLKSPLSLQGTAQEIFERSSPIIKDMIEDIIDHKIEPQPQKGEAVNFKRRKPADGSLDQLKDLNQVYDYIRMLDADGYPRAFLETEFFRIEFESASEIDNNELKANVRILKK